MVLEINEASGLEATEDSIGGFLAFLGCAIKELGEVDELWRGAKSLAQKH